MGTITDILKNPWTWAYILIGFVLPVVLHTTGVFYNTEEVEAGDSLWPMVIFAPAMLVFAANVWAFHRKS